MNRRWLVNRTNPEYIEYLSRTGSISPVLAQICINRGIKTPQDITDFLNPSISHLSDPHEIAGLPAAAERIKEALRKGEKVLVHGDYDADGLSATAILVHALKQLGLDAHYFIPHRITHGYGFNLAGVKRAKELGAGLIITVDCGIASFEAVAVSKREGIDVIITDHHEPLLSQHSLFGSENYLLPDALVVINPKISNPGSSVANLSGAGVAFKLVQALSTPESSSGHNSPLNQVQGTIHDLLDLAALGTMADVAEITGDNRILVKEGMALIQNGARIGLKALKEVSGIHERAITSGLIPFTIIPRINAAGRVSDSHDVVRLLLTDSEDEAIGISLWLDKLNAERQRIDEEVHQEALNKLNDKSLRSAIVLSSEGWHAGVIGIVASRIAEAFHKPTFIISIEGSTAKGSARSIPAFDIYEGLSGCREFLTGYGGHKQAAGFRLNAEDISRFEEMINGIVEETLTEKDFIPPLEIDADVSLSHITFNLIKELEMLEPLGFGNPEPLLGSRGLEVHNPRIVGTNHLKMRLRQKSYTIDAIGFEMGEQLSALSPQPSAIIDAVFTPFINEWEGGRCLQLNLKAFRLSL